VLEYTRSANSIAFCQTSSFSKPNMVDGFYLMVDDRKAEHGGWFLLDS
jgi:hypothetical protein